MPQELTLAEATLRARLRTIDPNSDAGNGTLLADATATLVAADAIATRVGPQIIADVTDQKLREALELVRLLLADPNSRGSDLPFGTWASSRFPGSAIVADQEYVLVAQHAGMMPEELAPMRLEGLNFKHLMRLIDRRSKHFACHALGRPEPFTEEARFIQQWLRFAPCEQAGGTRLEIPLRRPLAWATHAQLIDIADGVVHRMRTFWGKRRDLAARAETAVERFANCVSAAGSAGQGLDIAGLAARTEKVAGEERTTLSILVTTFDDAFRPTLARWCVRESDEGADMLRRIRGEHARRRQRSEEGRPLEIDGLAAAVVEAAPEGPAAVLARLDAGLATEVRLSFSDQRPLVARLYWSDGVIDVDLYAGRKLRHSSSCFHIPAADIPETALVSLVGRTIDAVVGLPMACPFPIVAAERDGEQGLRLSFQTQTRMVDFDAGAIAAMPTTSPVAEAA